MANLVDRPRGRNVFRKIRVLRGSVRTLLLRTRVDIARLNLILESEGLFKARLDEELGFEHDIALMVPAPPDSLSLSEVLQPAPRDLEDAQLRRMLDQGEFHGDLELIAFLMSRQLTRRDLIETNFPELRIEKFQLKQKIIEGRVRAALSDEAQGFQKAWLILTHPQKEAIEWMHFNNVDRKPLKKVARLLKLSPEELESRLCEALRIIRREVACLRLVKDNKGKSRQPG